MCSSDARKCPQDAASSDPQAALRSELQALRLGGLCQRAAEAGVGDDELCDAQVRSNDHSSATVFGCVPSLSKGCGQDEEDPKAAVIELILRGARAA